MNILKVGTVVRFANVLGIIVLHETAYDTVHYLIYHPGFTTLVACDNPTEFETRYLSWATSDRFEVVNDFVAKIFIEDKIKDDEYKIIFGCVTRTPNNHLKDLPKNERVKAILLSTDEDLSEFIVDFRDFTSYRNVHLTNDELKYCRMFYKYENMKNQKFEDAFRKDNPNNVVMKNLDSLYCYVNSKRSFEDEYFKRMKKKIFSDEWFKDVMNDELEKFVIHCDKNHYRRDDSCYVNVLHGDSVDYPKGTYNYEIIARRYISECNVREYVKYRKPIYGMKISNKYVQRMKVFLTYVAYRDYIINTERAKVYKNYQTNVKVKLAALDEHLDELLRKEEEYKLYYEFKNLIEKQ